MSERCGEDIIFMLTKDEVIACANELGMSEEQITEDEISLVKERVSQGLGGWRESVKGMVRDAIKCPLGLVCSPSCVWQEGGECTLFREVK